MASFLCVMIVSLAFLIEPESEKSICTQMLCINFQEAGNLVFKADYLNELNIL